MIEKIPFGPTGHNSTRTLFGAAALWDCDQALADKTLERLLEFGVNHIDVAPRYGNAEDRLGPWMAQHRKDFFLATKVAGRTRETAWEEINRSLERLRVDSVDLLQLHALFEPEEWEVAMGPGGALEAVLEARDQGITRFIGVTGHGLNVPAMHLRSLERFEFDAVLAPYNFVLMQDPAYRADFEQLAHKHSQDPSAQSNRGRLGFVSRGQFVNAFEEVAFTLKKGELSQPVRTQFGYHVIRLDDVRDVQVPPFEKVQQNIRQQLTQRKVAARVNELRDKAKIE